MKKFITFLLLALTIFSVAIPVQAADAATNDVYYGTPEIDGKVDDMYLNSYSMDITNHLGNIGEGTESKPQARSYVIYDEHYLYVCAVVKDEVIYSVGEAYLKLHTDEYENDCFEVFLNDNGLRFKCNIDAYGYNCFLGDGIATFKLENVVYATTVDEANGQYIVEMALPVPEIGPGKKLGYSIQVNSMNDETNGVYMTSSVSCDYNPLNFVTVSAATGETVEVNVITTEETTRRPYNTDPKDDETKAPDQEETKAPTTQQSVTAATTTASSATTLVKKDDGSNSALIWIIIAVVVVAAIVVLAVIFGKKKKN